MTLQRALRALGCVATAAAVLVAVAALGALGLSHARDQGFQGSFTVLLYVIGGTAVAIGLITVTGGVQTPGGADSLLGSRYPRVISESFPRGEVGRALTIAVPGAAVLALAIVLDVAGR